jgi:hypothetical protein
MPEAVVIDPEFCCVYMLRQHLAYCSSSTNVRHIFGTLHEDHSIKSVDQVSFAPLMPLGANGDGALG